jgi:hypothetical protein
MGKPNKNIISLLQGRELGGSVFNKMKKFPIHHHLQSISPKKAKLLEEELKLLDQELNLQKPLIKYMPDDQKKEFKQIQQRAYGIIDQLERLNLEPGKQNTQILAK